jgi:hypothetical protein
MQRGIHALPSVDRIGEHLEALPLQVEHIDNVSQGSYVCGVAWILCNGAYDVEVILSHGEAELFERDAVGDGTNRPVDESKRPDVRHCQLANDVAEDLYRESFKGPHLDFHFPSRPVTMLTGTFASVTRSKSTPRNGDWKNNKVTHILLNGWGDSFKIPKFT